MEVLEIGAGIGVITCLLRKLVGPGGWIRAVEANPNCHELIEDNLRQNHGGDHGTDIVWAALDYSLPSKSTAPFAPNVSHIISKIDGVEGTVLVPRATLADLLRGCPETGVLCLVADVEGAEAGFILLDQETLGRFHWLIVELHETVFQGNWLTPEDLILNLESVGFRLVERYGNVVAMMNVVPPQTEALLD